jgi:hypothetical protein
VRPQQFWLGPARAGQTVTLWIDTTTEHLSIDGVRIKTLPSRLSTVDLAGCDTATPAPPGHPRRHRHHRHHPAVVSLPPGR